MRNERCAQQGEARRLSTAQEPQVPAGVLGAAPLTFPSARAARGLTKNRAMFARSADELRRPHGFEQKPAALDAHGNNSDRKTERAR